MKKLKWKQHGKKSKGYVQRFKDLDMSHHHREKGLLHLTYDASPVQGRASETQTHHHTHYGCLRLRSSSLMLPARLNIISSSSRSSNAERGYKPSVLLPILHVGEELLPGIRYVKSQIIKPVPDP